MARGGWFGLLPFLERDDEPAQAPVEGLVLGGGGARGSFQLGALRYLYAHTDIAPTCIVATSAGSIVGAMLAQSLDPRDQEANLRRLESLWLSMRRPEDMFVARKWFADLLADDWLGLMDASGAAPEEPTNPLARLTLSLIRSPGTPPEVDDDAVPALPEDPQAATLALATQELAPDPINWSPSIMLQLLNVLPTIGKAGADIAQALRAAEATGSMYKPGPILTSLLSRDFFQSEQVARSGVRFRAAFVGLRTGDLRYMREDGQVVDRHDRPIGGTSYDLSMGVLASCSIPGVFRAVPMGDEIYVDGGLRENVPIELASLLGVQKAYVVTCHPLGVPTKRQLTQRDLVGLLQRSIEVLTDESERDEVTYARSIGATVIDPEFAVHDTMQIDPGLLTINRDYGWLRASEEHLGSSGATRQLHRDIISARKRCWELEEQILRSADGTGGDLGAVNDLKAQIRELLAKAEPMVLPPHAERWWQNFEKHADDPPKAG